MTVENAAEFNREVMAFAQTLTPKKFELFFKKIALEALSRLVQITPVDTGRARGNWQLTINYPADWEIDTVDKPGARTIAVGRNRLAQMSNHGLGQVVFISNNVDYIEELDEGRGSSQAPRGIVQPVLNELTQMFR